MQAAKRGARRHRGKRAPTRQAVQKTCADFGGVNDNGEPCQLVAGWGTGTTTGRCSLHNDEAQLALAEKKAAFLAEYSKGTNAALYCAHVIRRDLATVWRWRQMDPEFNAAYLKAQAHADDIRLQMIEDSQFQRILRGDHHASEAIFFLKNRGPKRWRDRTELTGAEGGALIPLDTIRAILDEDDAERERS
jgi:hypothetical protein